MKNDRVNNVENDREHVRHCDILEKTPQTNDTLNNVRSEILMLVNTVTGSHMSIIRQAALMFTHTHTHIHVASFTPMRAVK